QESAARTALREIRVTDKSLRPGDLLNRISTWKMANVSPEESTNYTDNDFDFLAAMAYRKYQTKLRSSGAVDFDDLLMLTNQLFSEHPEVLQRVQEKFEYVQIDEYQDT
ncbi:MAG TPA: AAA family ATPase, partial [Planctomycetaceae bacterium]|nr:AAA family ATPase [Planctomycetaceae bacterium]